MGKTLWLGTLHVVSIPSFNATILGNIVSVNVRGQRIVIVNSVEVTIEMLDKKGCIYSDRPTVPMGGELVGWKNTLVFIPYGPRFREARRMTHQLFGTQVAMKQFYPLEEQETRKFLKQVLAEPEKIQAHIRR